MDTSLSYCVFLYFVNHFTNKNWHFFRVKVRADFNYESVVVVRVAQTDSSQSTPQQTRRSANASTISSHTKQNSVASTITAVPAYENQKYVSFQTYF